MGFSAAELGAEASSYANICATLAPVLWWRGVFSDEIAYFMRDSVNDYQHLMRDDAEKVARDHQLRLSVYSAEENAERQLEQIKSVIFSPGKLPVAVVVSPVSEVTLLPLVHEAARRGVGWGFLTRWHDAITDIRAQYPNVPIFSVSADQEQVGAVQGQQLHLVLNPGDEVVYIQGPLGTSTTRQRWQSLQREVAGRGLNIGSFHGNWSEAGGEEVMATWLNMFSRGRIPKVAVGAQNDSMAVGATRALAERYRRKGELPAAAPLAFGCDGSNKLGRRLVDSGGLTATVVIPSVGGPAVEEFVAVSRRGRTSVPQIVMAVSSYPPLDVLAESFSRNSIPAPHRKA